MCLEATLESIAPWCLFRTLLLQGPPSLAMRLLVMCIIFTERICS